MLKLDRLFTSHMVFAANLPIRVFGEGEGVAEVIFAQYRQTVVPTNGKWLVEFPPMSYGGPYALTLRTEEDTVTLDDIYVGEVLLCAGQSNIQMMLSQVTQPEDGAKPNKKLRFFDAGRFEENARFTPEDGWIVSDAENSPHWSALGFLTGSKLCEGKGVAVGIVGCYQGASMIESWVPAGTYQRAGIAVPDELKYPDYDHPVFAQWNRDGRLYDGFLSKLMPFSFSAVVWYQGESNCSTAGGAAYSAMLALLIDCWRVSFRNDRLPFVIVQIADYIDRDTDGWHAIQQAQWDVQFKRENVKTVISADVCETDDIHPPTKHLLADRIVGALEEVWY